jgi:TrmH family RNA methyltransferase
MSAITSLSNEKVKLAVSLHQKKYREETGLFLVEGAEPVLGAIKNGWELVTGFSIKEIEGNWFRETKENLEKITKKTNPSEVVGVFRKRLNTELGDRPAQVVLPALEEVRDGGNLGTIMRSCHALKLRHLLLIGNCCDPFAPEVIRASMGSFSFIELTHLSHEEFFKWFRKHPNTSVIGTDVIGAKDYREADYRNSVLILGNETQGMSRQLRDVCAEAVHIPMPGGTESLNLSVSAALILYEAVRP